MNLLLLSIVIILLLALLETPVFTVIAALSVACFYLVDHDPLALQTIFIEMNRLGAMPVLVALPLFTFVGCLLTETRAPERIVRFIEAFVGWFARWSGHGGSVRLCLFLPPLPVPAGWTIVALGSILYPVMRDRGYAERFTLGLLTTSGSLGLLFPPSLPVILYGVVAQVDIGRIFKAALIPGLIIVVALCTYAFVNQRRNGQTRTHRRISFNQVKTAFMGGIWEMAADRHYFGGGSYGGWVTIAEVSAPRFGLCGYRGVLYPERGLLFSKGCRRLS